MGRKSKAEKEYEAKIQRISEINEDWYYEEPRFVETDSYKVTYDERHVKAMVDRVLHSCSLSELNNIKHWTVHINSVEAKESICISIPCSTWTTTITGWIDTGERKIDVKTTFSESTRL